MTLLDVKQIASNENICIDCINQISYEPCSQSENPELLEYSPDDKLVQLNAAVHGYKTRRCVALAAYAGKSQEIGVLNEKRSLDEAKKESAVVEMDALRATMESLLAEQEVCKYLQNLTSINRIDDLKSSRSSWKI